MNTPEDMDEFVSHMSRLQKEAQISEFGIYNYFLDLLDEKDYDQLRKEFMTLRDFYAKNIAEGQ